MKRILAIVSCMVMLLCFVGCGGNETNGGENTSVEKSENQTSEKVSEEETGIEITESEIVSREYGFWTVVFKIKNTGSVPIGNISLDAEELDANGDILNLSSPWAEAVLDPGQSISVETVFEDNIGIKTIEITGYEYYIGEAEDGDYVEKSFKEPLKIVLE